MRIQLLTFAKWSAITHVEQRKGTRMKNPKPPTAPGSLFVELEEKTNDYFKGTKKRHGNKGKETEKRRLYYR